MKSVELENNTQIVKIAIHELDEFTESELFKGFKIKPISPNRASSYKNNPRCDSYDTVIYLLLNKEELICFRTVLPDLAFIEDKPLKFCWLSGNYTMPQHRRRGYSKILLKEIYNDYERKLMYTNYAPEAHLLLANSGKFDCLAERIGIRIYGDINLNKYIRSKMAALFIPFGNLFLKIAASIKRFLYKVDKSIEVVAHSHNIPNDIGTTLNFGSNLFKRAQTEFNWIQTYPWLTLKEECKNYSYPFSFYTKDYKYHYIEVKHNNNLAHILLFERDRDIKVAYVNYTDSKTAAKAILNQCYHSKAKTLTVLNKEISKCILRMKNPFIYSKPFKMGIYKSFPIANSEKYTFQDGDGDNIFT